MPTQLALRFASLLLTAALWIAVGDKRWTFQAITYSMGFVHYTLALRYSNRQIAQATSSLPRDLALLALIFVALSLYQQNLSLVVYFGIHHAFNEAFRKSAAEPRPAPLAGFFLQATAFAVALRHDAGFVGVDGNVLVAAFAMATLVCADRFVANIGSTSAARLADLWAPELAAITLAAVSFVVRVEFLQVVLYHFVLWSLLPMEQMRSRGRRSLATYLGATVAMTFAFVSISPIGPEAARISPLRFTELFLFSSYAHITLSFALSDAHPDWMVRLFRGNSVRVRRRLDAQP